MHQPSGHLRLLSTLRSGGRGGGGPREPTCKESRRTAAVHASLMQSYVHLPTEISARARPVLCKCREQDACVGKVRGDKGGGGVQGRLTSVSAERDVERPSLVRNMACPWADKRRSGTLPRHSRDRFGFCP